jgi:hypothetical protein
MPKIDWKPFRLRRPSARCNPAEEDHILRTCLYGPKGPPQSGPAGKFSPVRDGRAKGKSRHRTCLPSSQVMPDHLRSS